MPIGVISRHTGDPFTGRWNYVVYSASKGAHEAYAKRKTLSIPGKKATGVPVGRVRRSLRWGGSAGEKRKPSLALLFDLSRAYLKIALLAGVAAELLVAPPLPSQAEWPPAFCKVATSRLMVPVSEHRPLPRK